MLLEVVAVLKGRPIFCQPFCRCSELLRAEGRARSRLSAFIVAFNNLRDFGLHGFGGDTVCSIVLHLLGAAALRFR